MTATAAPTRPGPSPALKGLLWILVAFFLYSVADAILKHLTFSYPVVQITWARYTFHLVMVVLWLGRQTPQVMATKRPLLHIGRGTFQFLAGALFVAGVSILPLADSLAIQFMAPILVTALSVPILGEPVGLRRWLGVAAGFAGALVIIRPGVSAVAAAALLPLFAAVFSALYQVMTRIASRHDSTATSFIYAALVGSLVASVAVPFFWVQPDAVGWTLMIASGVIAGLGHFAHIRALTLAPAASLAPFAYLNLVWGALFGFLLWGDFPDVWTIGGAFIIMASGLYIFHRERLARRRKPPGA